MVDNLTQGPQGFSRFEALFPSGTSDDVIKRARAGLEVLARTTSDVALAGQGQVAARTGAAQIREVALTGASGDKGFGLRAGLTAMMAPVVEKALYSPEGVRRLLDVEQASRGLRLVSRGGPEATLGAATQGLNVALRDYNNYLAEQQATQEADELKAQARTRGQQASANRR